MAVDSAPRRLAFYFDYISHNAYLAWSELGELAETYELTVDPIPVLFAGLLDAHGQLGPAEIPAKARWMVRDVLRKSARYGVTLAPPASHPFNPLPTLRVTSLPLLDERRSEVVSALFEATWARSLDVGEPDVVAGVLDELGLDGRALMSAASSVDARHRLRSQTDSAVKAGVFGVPTLMIEGELFWGFDDLAHLELYLRGEDPLPEDALAEWDRVQPSAERPRPGGSTPRPGR